MTNMFWIPPFIAGLLGVKAITKATGGKVPSKGASALVIGDSHTEPTNGWAEAMAKKYQFRSLGKLAKAGRKTDVMLSTLKLHLASNKAPNYIIMWGGANDSYGEIPQATTLKNVQAMIDLAKSKGSTFIIVKGYDPMKVSYNFDLSKMYRGSTQSGLTKARNEYVKLLSAYDKFKSDNVIVVPAYTGFTRADSTDGLHLKMDKYPILGQWVGSQVFIKP
jgi:lysophospholipase L1-like esterase